MMLEPLLIVELAVLGVGTGFLAGLLGIGGGMLMVPFLTLILANRSVSPDLAVKMAIATSMATIIFTSLSSVRAHHQRGAVRWDIVKRLAPGIVIGSIIGSLAVFALLKGSYLAIFFGLFVSFSATQMFLVKKPKPTRPIHNAVATSAALGFPIAMANVLGYAISGQSVQNLPEGAFGYIWLPALLVIAVCSFATAPLGARAAHNIPVGKLKRVFASILYVLAAYMLYKGFKG